MTNPQDEPPTQPVIMLAPGMTPTPEYYADSVRMIGSSYTVSLLFGVLVTPTIVSDSAIVRMSPQHAKMMAILLRRFVQMYEAEQGTIQLTDKLLADKEIDLARDWDGL